MLQKIEDLEMETNAMRNELFILWNKAISATNNPADNNECTPLHLASLGGHFGICQLFIERLEDKNPSDKDGKTPQEQPWRLWMLY